jgi:hypothetical protein
MSRPPFQTDIGNITKFTDGDGNISFYYIFDAQRASEVSSGTTRRRKPRSWVPPTSYSLFYRRWQRAYGTYTYVHNPSVPNSKYSWIGVIGGAPSGEFNSLNHFDSIALENDLYDAELTNQALIKARLQLKGTKVNLGVAFAERNQTAKLLGDTAIRLAKSFNELRRGHVRNAMRQLGISSKAREPRGSSVPNKWLELQYGWKPLLSDVYGSAVALEEVPAHDWRVTVKATARSEKTFQGTYAPISDAGICTATGRNSVFTRLDALPGNEPLGSLASLGITNPLLIAWELVPFSFIIDWAFPIGNWLDSLDALLGYESAYYSSSYLTRSEWVGKGVNVDLGNGFGGYVDADYLETKKIVRLVRTASDSVPLPNFPPIKDGRSLGHMANGLALLASVFGKR